MGRHSSALGLYRNAGMLNGVARAWLSSDAAVQRKNAAAWRVMRQRISWLTHNCAMQYICRNIAIELNRRLIVSYRNDRAFMRCHGYFANAR
jgi:hypothetical protein